METLAVTVHMTTLGEFRDYMYLRMINVQAQEIHPRKQYTITELLLSTKRLTKTFSVLCNVPNIRNNYDCVHIVYELLHIAPSRPTRNHSGAKIPLFVLEIILFSKILYPHLL